MTANLQRLLDGIHRGDHRSEPHSLRLLCQFHQGLFDGIRSHAGKIRCRASGSERLVFGPHRSSHRDEVEAHLADVFTRLERSLRSLDDNREDEAYERSSYHIAAWSHAEIIRVHPFEDGNGRSSRAFLNSILVRQDLRPVAVEATKDEYITVLNIYIVTRDINPLLSLYLRLADEQLN